ncbi:fungal-specific transcription factor domain-containing protein [Paraphoma chrysanthemicola]|uniref:Fungal-specific transcription factor domain-containing protein n=1 Tax=Paraphoma chrysanthemicola TaxID=798071 RepID=A0A8K0RDL1_9PLEO|nr:fungal-specific transcription factor domain-containing protein [Paraphoma chrysanthemicola]
MDAEATSAELPQQQQHNQHQHESQTHSLSPEPRTRTKRRAAVACLTCRTRKVRCDVALRGQPCTNCSTDEITCSIKTRPKRYNVQKAKAAATASVHEDPPAKPNEGTSITSTASNQIASANQANMDHLELDAWLSLAETALCSGGSTFDFADMAPLSANCPSLKVSRPQDSTVPEAIENTFAHGTESVALSMKMFTALDESGPDSTCPKAGTANSPQWDVSQLPPKPFVPYTHYSFVESHASQVASLELEIFMEAMQCFVLPGPTILDEFVRQYFLHVHPNIPVLDEGEFMSAYCQCTQRGAQGRKGVSLFLLQGMLYASSTFVSDDVIRRLNIGTTRQARDRFYRAAKTLYQNTDPGDPIVSACGLLMLSYHHSSTDQIGANSYWLAMAIQTAREVQAHSYEEPRHSIAHRRRLKRLWWSCIFRDRIMSLGLHRPLFISSDDFDLSLPPLTVADLVSDVNESYFCSTSTKQNLALITEQMCQLAIVLTDVLMLVVPRKGPMVPESESEARRGLKEADKCMAFLDHWREKSRSIFERLELLDEADKSLHLYIQINNIYFHTGKMALHHYALYCTITSSRPGASWLASIVACKNKLQDTAQEVTTILVDLLQSDLLQYLPISIVAYAAFPYLLHVLDTKLHASGQLPLSKQRTLNDYKIIMKRLQKSYAGTDLVLGAMSALASRLKIENQGQRLLVGLESAGHRDASQQSVTQSSGSSELRPREERMGQWSDLVMCQPAFYLRLAFMFDWFMSTGKYPHETEMPVLLRNQQLSIQIH